MFKICVVTATRAEYGLLRPLLLKLKNNKDVILQLVVTGTHLSEKYGNTQNEIKTDGFTSYYSIPLPLDDDSRKGMAIVTGLATEKFAAVFSELKPDVVVILGDRYEMLGVATAAYLLGITIAHICGGDVTEGAVDDSIRHCITKMSYLHFPSCEQSAKRIIQMGEAPARVFNVGEPGVENCLNIQFLSRTELAKQIGFQDIMKDYCVITFHPVTMENGTEKLQVQELIKAMDSFQEMSYVITKSNADAGGRCINDIWEQESKCRNNWLVVDSLGMKRYLSAVKYSRLVIGNSSSGLVEVPALGVPTINIGDRQKGRMLAKSVINSAPDSIAITKAMRKGLSDKFYNSIKGMQLPFGNGTTSLQVMNVILQYLKNPKLTNKKSFYNIDYFRVVK